MFKIGVTGNIGSGKSTVCRVFNLLGIPVFYADTAAKNIMTTDNELIKGIRNAFGEPAYFQDGSLNRKFIADIVFNKPGELQKLNALVHPAVFRAFDNWAANITDAPYVIKEAALLFESTSYTHCDSTLLVSAPLEMRKQRVMTRDNISSEEVLAREARQMNEEKKKSLANYIIANDESSLLIPQVLALHNVFLNLAIAKHS